MNEQEQAVPCEGQPEPGPEVTQPAWRERVAAEYHELSARIEALGVVLEAKERGERNDIDPVSHALLIAQHAAMISYQSILFLRLNVETRG